jgi:TetR/AcrR family transcriptional regulator, cholesterol catabolism regulator
VPRKPDAPSPRSGEAGSKSARTRQRILDAAAYVLSRKGYAGTRLSDVAGQAEIQAPVEVCRPRDCSAHSGGIGLIRR